MAEGSTSTAHSMPQTEQRRERGAPGSATHSNGATVPDSRAKTFHLVTVPTTIHG